MKYSKRALRMNRETLRDLSVHQLQWVAGGTVLVDPVDPVTAAETTARDCLASTDTQDCTVVACR